MIEKPLEKEYVKRWIELCSENGHKPIGQPNPLGLCICMVAEGMSK